MSETAEPDITLRLPIPPSVNDRLAVKPNGRRYLKRHVISWRQQAGAEILAARPEKIAPDQPYRVRLTLRGARGDADNRLKEVLDLLVAHRLTGDDRLCVRVEARKHEMTRPSEQGAVVEVWAAASEPKKQKVMEK